MLVERYVPNAVDAVVLDLGGVICRYDFEHAHRIWREATGLSPEELRARIRASDLAHRFERGELDPGAFVAEVNAAIGATFSEPRFTEIWNGIFLGYTEGIESLIPKIRSRARLVCLSNTNALHASFWRAEYAPCLAHFERIFTSHELGARKPEPEAFRPVLDYLNLPPSRVAFFDDVEAFVEGARAVGIRGYRVTSTEGMAKDLAPLIGPVQ